MVTKIPDEVLAFIEHQEPELKDSPDHFVGRIDELDSLQWMIDQTMPKQPALALAKEKSGKKPPGRMYIAAPGAGKTSLMLEFTERLEEQGFSVIHTKPVGISTAEKFAEVIRKQPPWSSREGRQRVINALSAGLAKGVDRTTAAGITGTALVHGVPLAIADIEVAQTILAKWQEGQTPTTRETLQLLQLGKPRGCVLVVDEAQDIADYVPDKDKREHIDSVIRHLGIPADRKELGIERATIILAGLSDTPTAVDNVGSQGILPQVVAPLNRSAVREVMRLAIQDGCGRNKKLARELKHRWLDALVDEYGDWTRQAQAGAQAATRLLQKYGTRLRDEDWGWAAVRLLGDRFREKVYGDILRRTHSAGTDRETPQQIIDATTRVLIRNGNRIEQHKLLEFLDAVLKRVPLPGSERTDDERAELAARYIQRMLRTGVIDRTNHLPHKADRKPHAYYSPIPSLLHYTNEEPTSWDVEIREVAQASGLKFGEPTPRVERFRPQWPTSTPVAEEPDAAGWNNIAQRILRYVRERVLGK